MSRVDVPCLNCQDRFLGCHSVCKKYKEFKEYKNNINEQRHQLLHDLHKSYIVRADNPWRT